jgi:hypothetical protein
MDVNKSKTQSSDIFIKEDIETASNPEVAKVSTRIDRFSQATSNLW